MINIAFAIPTWIRTAEERDIVFETIKTLQSYHFPIVLVDKNSSEKDKTYLRQLQNVSFFEETKNLMMQIRLSHSQAAKKADHIFYLQADKLDFVQQEVPKMLQFYSNLHTKGLLTPSRTQDSLATYPPFQRTQEAFLNFFMSDYIGIPQDYFAGPKIFPKQLVSYTSLITGDIGWGIESFYYVLAKRLHVPFDFFPCFITAPKDVDEEEKTKTYRLLGTKWQIDGFLQAQNIPL